MKDYKSVLARLKLGDEVRGELKKYFGQEYEKGNRDWAGSVNPKNVPEVSGSAVGKLDTFAGSNPALPITLVLLIICLMGLVWLLAREVAVGAAIPTPRVNQALATGTLQTPEIITIKQDIVKHTKGECTAERLLRPIGTGECNE